jgi:hypothetical protein
MAQIEIGIQKELEPDRHFEKGGRSFYFFDFDDNIATLDTRTFVFHRETGEELSFNSRDWTAYHRQIGRPGPLADYRISFCDRTGSFRNFRDRPALDANQSQLFVDDVERALSRPIYDWQGPSWSCFHHAVFNRRPVALITARGHHPLTLQAGVRRMVERGYLPHEPNYLAVLPVSHQEVRSALMPASVESETEVAALKQAAIRRSVDLAFRTYGFSPFHRFGMSDDDPRNLELITEEMRRLKRSYPLNSFFVISTHSGEFVKTEVFDDHNEERSFASLDQMNLLDDGPRQEQPA